MLRSKAMGGPGLPNLRYYYYAALLDQIQASVKPSTDKLWVSIEKAILMGRDLPSLLKASSLNRPLYYPKFPSIDASLEAWRAIASQAQSRIPTHNMDLSLTTYEFYSIPSGIDSKNTYQLYLTQADWHHYYTKAQLQYYHTRYPETSCKLPTEVWQYMSSRLCRQKGISWFYTYLQSCSKFNKTTSMLNWEKDLQAIYSHKEWSSASLSILKASHCTNHWELAMKLHRSYLTPIRLNRIFVRSSDRCWRDCGDIGTLLHIMFGCRCLRSFWNTVAGLIVRVTGLIFPLKADLAVLNLGMTASLNTEHL